MLICTGLLLNICLKSQNFSSEVKTIFTLVIMQQQVSVFRERINDNFCDTDAEDNINHFLNNRQAQQ